MLLKQLDTLLPSKLTISIRDFFSFLPFVTKTNQLIKSLRILVNQAKQDSTKEEYATFYDKHLEFFNRALNLNVSPKVKFIPTLQDEPSLVTKSTVPGSSVAMKKKLTPASDVNLEKYLKCIHCKDATNEFLSLLSDEEKRQLIKILFVQFHNDTTKYFAYKEYAFRVVDSYSNSLSILKKEIFEDLQNGHAVELFSDYLTFKEKHYVSKLLETIDNVGNSKNPEGCQYKNTPEYARFKHFIRPLRGNASLIEDHKIIKEIPERLAKLHDQYSASTSVKKLFSKITRCLDFLSPIFDECITNPLIYNHHIKTQQEQAHQLSKLQEYNDFRKSISNYEVQQVSIQRLKEICLNPNNLEMLIKQCEKFGVCVFDMDSLSPQQKKELFTVNHPDADANPSSISYQP